MMYGRNEREDRICRRHGVKLKKNMAVDGRILYVCPSDKKCSYKENEDGEKV